MESTVLVAHCKASDFDASAQTCAAVFWGPSSSFPPPMDVGEGISVSAVIAGAWAIGYMIRQSRRAVGA
ncbi:hypothetical protein XaraCFBP7407_18755 [Xanthomonas arboricola pv. arracaciae]|nr:hypothetical protein XaraCFBP7407_18755 [Xanthomonas arboricola pv. arracaciae]